MRARYGDADQAITITLTSLGYRAARQSAQIDNRTTLYDDVYVSGRVKTAVGGSEDLDGAFQIYVYGSQNGTTFPSTIMGSVTGADAAFGTILDTADGLVPIGGISTNVADTSFVGGLWSIARALGGTVPPFWGIVVLNACGRSLSAVAGDHEFVYQGLWRTVE